jgi:RHS repeat-associated protein
MPTQTHKIVLLAIDQHNSILVAQDENQIQHSAYAPYGHRSVANGLLSFLGFNGELTDPLTRHYHLGNGYRQFNPVSMRFNGPDSWSPFGKGGPNTYGYCKSDPINRSDQSGHASKFWMAVRDFFSARNRVPAVEPAPPTPVFTSPHTSSLLSSAEVVRPNYRNPLANVRMDTQVPTARASTSRLSATSDGVMDRISYPPSYLQRPDSPPPIYRSSPLNRAPTTPGDLPPNYVDAAHDPIFQIRVTTIRVTPFVRRASLSARLIRN